NDIELHRALRDFYAKQIEAAASGDQNVKPWQVEKLEDCPDTDTIWHRLQNGVDKVNQSGQLIAHVGSKLNIAANLDVTIEAARAVDPAVRVVMVNYPYVVSEDNVCFRDHDQWHGSGAVIDELAVAHAMISADGVATVDLRSGFGSNPTDPAHP